MKQYHDALRQIMDEGVDRPDRTGTGTRSIFGLQMRFDLSEGFPAITTKKLAWRAVTSELLFFIEGSGDEHRLREILHGDRDSEKPTIWTENAQAPYWKPKAKYDGDLGRVYGQQWRKFPKPPVGFLDRIKQVFTGPEYVDQIAVLIDGIKSDPYGHRHVLTAWNPGELDQMALPPCHMFAQFYVSPMSKAEMKKAYSAYRKSLSLEIRKELDKQFEAKSPIKDRMVALNLPTEKLSCQMYQRSADFFLGVPFNIASYSLFTHMIAQVCGLAVGEFVHTFGDAHIYHNHFDQVVEQLNRTEYPLPTLWLNPEVKTIDGFTMDDINLVGYQSHPAIKAKMAV